MKSKSPKKNTDKNDPTVKRAIQALALMMGFLAVISGFDHYERTGALGMTLAYIVFGVGAVIGVIITFLDERRERIRKEKLEDAERLAEILSAPLSKYNEEEMSLEKAVQALEKKYKR